MTMNTYLNLDASKTLTRKLVLNAHIKEKLLKINDQQSQFKKLESRETVNLKKIKEGKK